MCGRYAIDAVKHGWPGLEGLLNPVELASLRNSETRPDIRPTQLVPMIRWSKGEPLPKLATARWGFIPDWWKQDKPPQSTFNARSEEAPQKPMWRQAVRHTRCLIPFTSWYEWTPLVNPETGEIKMKADGRTPVKLQLRLGNPETPAACFAGLWSRARFKDAAIETCTIVTRAALPPLDKLHDRMPVIVSPADYREWLDPAMTQPEVFQRVIEAIPPAEFRILNQE